MAGKVIARQQKLLPARRSLAGWAMLAVFLVIISHVFSILLAVAWVYLPYLLFDRTGNLNAHNPLVTSGGLVSPNSRDSLPQRITDAVTF